LTNTGFDIAGNVFIDQGTDEMGRTKMFTKKGHKKIKYEDQFSYLLLNLAVEESNSVDKNSEE